jgi:radical SAM superfamily enzyme YgiQ (UPF0313 family)
MKLEYSSAGNRGSRIDCLLLNPPDDFSRYPYLGLCLLAAVLRQRGIRVEILDSTALGYSMQDILEYVSWKRPRIIGISVMSMMLRFCYALIKQIRERFPDTIVVVGGAHIDADPGIVKEMPVHYGFYGECELSFAAFCKQILEGKTPTVGPGMIRRDGGEIIVGEEPAEQNLDTLPIPAYDLLSLDKYFSPSTSLRTMSFISSRGCPYNCAFCSKLRKRKYRFLSTDNAVAQLEVLINKYHVQWIEFVDEIFALNRERVFSLCNGISSSNLHFSWGMATRADRIDEDLLLAVKEAGCRKVSFGIETGVERVRFAAHKKITNEQITDAIALCRKHGMKTMGDFIFGHPTETAQEMHDTVSFARKCGLNYAYFNRMIPIPNSEIFEVAKASGQISQDAWIQFMKGQIPFPIYVPRGVSPEIVDRIYKRAWFEMYFWPPTLWRNRSVLTDPVRIWQTGRALAKSISDKRYKK